MTSTDPFARLASAQSVVDTERQQLFRQLKSPCVALSKSILATNPNLREVTLALLDLHKTLQTLSDAFRAGFDKKFGDYVFFPLSQVLQRHESLNDRAVELALLCLEFLIQTSWRVEVPGNQAQQFIILLTFIIGGRPQDGRGGSSDKSDETKCAGCRCLLGLFESISRSDKSVVTRADLMPAIGHTITILLSLVSTTSMQELQLVSLKSISVLVLDCMNDEDVRASFYPGVVSSLVKAIGLGKTTKQPYQVLVAIIKFLSSVIYQVLGDNKVSALSADLKSQESDELENLKIQRSQPWLRVTAMNTKAALDNVLKLRAHAKSEVRKAVFELCRDILEYCTSSLSESSMTLVETMLVLAADENEQLTTLSLNTLKVMTASNANIKESIRDSLHGWIIALPRVMNGSDEAAKTRVIIRVAVTFGLITELGMESDLLEDILSDSIRESLIPNASLNSVSPTVQASAKKPRSLDLLVTSGTSNREERHIVRFPEVVMGNRIQTSTLGDMKRLLELLGRSSNNSLRLAQRHVRDASAQRYSSQERANSLWIALNLLRGSLTIGGDEMNQFLDFELSETSGLERRVTEELFTASLSIIAMDIQLETGLEEDPLENCFALEALSLVAETRGPSFRGDLVDVLYPVVHHLGASSPQVQNHAIVALNNIAYACEYSSAKELLLDNVDYMVNAVSLKLNTFSLSQQAPIVLTMMVKLVGPSLVPYLDDLVVSIFAVLDGYHGYEKLCEGLFQVLGSIVEETSKDDEIARITEGEGSIQKKKQRAVLSDKQLIESLHQEKGEKRSELELEDDNDQSAFPREPWGKAKAEDASQPSHEGELDEEDIPPPREDEVVKVSKSYEIVQRIARLSQHYLTHESFSLRIQLLQLISTASLILGGNENEFLPLVNDIWPVVYDRLLDSETHIVIGACHAIASIAQTTGDFLASRIKDGWTGIRKVYVQAYENLEWERRVGKDGLGVYSVNYKLWDASLSLLTALVSNVRLRDEVLDDICRITGGKVLEEREEFREAVERIARDAVWLEVQSWRKEDLWSGMRPASLEGVDFVISVF